MIGRLFLGKGYEKSYLFKDHFGFSTPLMKAALSRPVSYHNLKNLWPTWLEGSEERSSKAMCFILFLLLMVVL